MSSNKNQFWGYLSCFIPVMRRGGGGEEKVVLEGQLCDGGVAVEGREEYCN